MEALFRTKLQIPTARTRQVVRTHLELALDEGCSGKLTLVTAPAGFGKTTAVARWARRAAWPVAWFSVDAADNSLRGFWRYMVVALGSILPGLEQRLAQYFPATVSGVAVDGLLGALVEESLQAGGDFILVLDDFHLLTEATIHESLAGLLKYLPANAHLVVISRAQAPFWAARLQTDGQLLEIGASQLQFSLAEIADLCQLKGISLAADDLQALAARTEGWAAGLSLLLDAAGKDREGLGLLPVDRQLGSQQIALYLSEEVSQRWGAAEQSFMLQTSILPTLSGPLCDALTGRNDGSEMLERLARQNAFLVVLDQENGWYRYHHLYAEFLQQQLGKGDAATRFKLHQRAGDWYAQNGHTGEAVRQYLEGGCHELAADVIEAKGREMLKTGDLERLTAWLGSLPASVVEGRILLSLTYAWALVIADRVSESKRLVQRMEGWLAEQGAHLAPDWQRQLEGEVAALHGFIGLKQQDAETTAHYLAKFHSLMTTGSIFLAFGVNFNMGEASLLAGMFAMKGRLQVVERGFTQIYERNRSQQQATFGFIPVLLGEMLFERNRLDEAVPLLVKGIEEAEQGGSVGCVVPVTIALCRLMMARGDLGGALTVLADGEKKLKRMGSLYLLPKLAAFRARVHLELQQTDAVADWMQHNGLDLFASPSIPKMYEHITLTRVLLARQEYEYCLLILSKLLSFAQSEQNLFYALEILSLQAIAQHALGQTQQALEVLRQALQLGEQHGYYRLFIEEGAPMAALLSRFVRTQKRPDAGATEANPAVSPSYLRGLLRETRAYCVILKDLVGKNAQALGSSVRRQVELTKREREVLRLLNSDLSGAEIAYTLDISINTVRVNCSNIYRKLNAQSRFQAVDMARELGILD